MKENLIGKKFGRVTVIDDAPSHFQPSGQRKRCVVGRCDCGKVKKFRATALRSGMATSCGCFKVEMAGTHTLKHGGAINGTHTRTYKSWVHMKDRCLNPRNKSYKDYGGRGISICGRWLNNFPAFMEDMGEKPAGLMLERKNNNGNYEPSNCRWATRKEQNSNKRVSLLIKYRGETKTATQWERDLGLPKNRIVARMKRGMSGQGAIEKPLRQWPGPIYT